MTRFVHHELLYSNNNGAPPYLSLESTILLHTIHTGLKNSMGSSEARKSTPIFSNSFRHRYCIRWVGTHNKDRSFFLEFKDSCNTGALYSVVAAWKSNISLRVQFRQRNMVTNKCVGRRKSL